MAAPQEIEHQNLVSEVALLRELVALLLAQIPETQAKADAMRLAADQAAGAYEKLSPGYIGVQHAFNQQVERTRRYLPIDETR